MTVHNLHTFCASVFDEPAGGPTVADSDGYPWNGMSLNANGDPSVDLRSNIAAESRAKIVYESDAVHFLMTREVTRFQSFSAALSEVVPVFPRVSFR